MSTSFSSKTLFMCFGFFFLILVFCLYYCHHYNYQMLYLIFISKLYIFIYVSLDELPQIELVRFPHMLNCRKFCDYSYSCKFGKDFLRGRKMYQLLRILSLELSITDTKVLTIFSLYRVKTAIIMGLPFF
jgi:hypothetical protein